MSKWMKRLSHTEYKRCKPTLVKMKLLLHLDGYLNVFDATILDMSRFRDGLAKVSTLAILRNTLSVLFGKNPKRFRYRKPEPKGLRDQNYEANLELNKALSHNPEHEGPGFIPENLKETSLDILKEVLEVPSIEDRRKVTAFEVHRTKLQLFRGSAKLKPGTPTEGEYLRLKAKVFKFHCFEDTILRTLERVSVERSRHMYDIDSELEPICFIELLLRYDRQLWYLTTHDFMGDPSYVRIRPQLAKLGEVSTDSVEIKLDSLENGILSREDLLVPYLTDHLVKGVKIPRDISLISSDLSSPITPSSIYFVNRATKHYTLMRGLVESICGSLRRESTRDEAELISLESAVSLLERDHAWAYKDDFDVWPRQVFTEARRLLRLPHSVRESPPSCGCTLNQIFDPEDSSHVHGGWFIGENR
jgi:hypothetical protein